MRNTAQFTRLAVSVLAVALTAITSTAFAAQPDASRPYAGHMGPGMMGGGGMMGHGMMGGYGMGSGMMGPGMGPGMMGSYGWGRGLNLTKEQQTKINKIQDETRKTHWSLMGAMMDQQAKLRDLYEDPKSDKAAIEAAQKNLDQLHQQMFSSAADARKRIDAVLTKQQQDKLRSYWEGGGW
ncbi:Spy/CpxP family protein refolding chaperone [Crenobacter sp. SG2305]|uniref:Spy/CpxP family protein refolding chaperone n=1 Tax=Crenobacter oryzisoli TaxID=3056844 RepID=UPI0025AA44D2|nr:Spy/CpxP family protein refolding chaperone [Crenobacter sp. SG2305]MDN0084944.1 Spy/CpxP family protein refolding chaperone [Crenobacter sp. SG2305]